MTNHHDLDHDLLAIGPSELFILESTTMDKQHCKVFVGGLNWETTDEKLRRYFENYGTVLEAFVSYDRVTMKPRGFGFVVFEDPAVADKVVKLQHTIDRREVRAYKAVGSCAGGRSSAAPCCSSDPCDDSYSSSSSHFVPASPPYLGIGYTPRLKRKRRCPRTRGLPNPLSLDCNRAPAHASVLWAGCQPMCKSKHCECTLNSLGRWTMLWSCTTTTTSGTLIFVIRVVCAITLQPPQPPGREGLGL